MNRARRIGRIGADAVTGRIVAVVVATSAVLMTAACTQTQDRHPRAEAAQETGTKPPTPGPDAVDPPPSGATTPGSPTAGTGAPAQAEPPPAAPAVEDAPTAAGGTRAPAGPAIPRMPAQPSIAETNAALEKARILRARGLDPRSDRVVKAADHGCFAHESQPSCSEYLAARELGRAYAAATTRHDPADTRPRPPTRPVLPRGCVIAAAVPNAQAPKGFLLACADYTPE
ncbi:hypothetical protein [Embleya scabrispora]|uniref:hypothetical protein n=1 Tax=Embleya scabrispora TaxID=159449 RepID=UPI00039F6712|nr:hypothetical protein [Embleya scabrispora]